MSSHPTALFLVGRNLYYRFFGPLIDACLKRGWRVEVAHNYDSSISSGPKANSVPLLNQIPQFQNGVVHPWIYRTNAELNQTISQSPPNFIFTLHSRTYFEFDAKKHKDVLWVTLQHSADNILEGRAFGECDLFAMLGESWFEKFEEILKDSSKKLLHVGFPVMDQTLTFNDEEIRQKYRLPKQKPIVTYVALDHPSLYSIQNIFKKLWFKTVFASDYTVPAVKLLRRIFPQIAPTEQKLVRSIAKFCKRNDCHFIIKSRTKRIIPKDIADLADSILYDETFYPSTNLELFYISDVSINTVSMATYESVFLHCFAISVFPQWLKDDFIKFPRKIWGENWTKFHDWSGASKTMSIRDFIGWFPNLTLDDVQIDEKARSEFVERFLGFDDTSSSERLLKHLEKR